MNNYAIAVTERGYTTPVEVGFHEHVTDEPVNVGGKDLGPSPYDLLISALASCTSITLRMYADRKKLPVEKIVVTVTHERIYRDDADHSEEGPMKIDHFERKIRIHGDLEQSQLDRMLEIANKCPIHYTLTTTARVDTSIEN